jgi:hypothetical protein
MMKGSTQQSTENRRARANGHLRARLWWPTVGSAKPGAGIIGPLRQPIGPTARTVRRGVGWRRGPRARNPRISRSVAGKGPQGCTLESGFRPRVRRAGQRRESQPRRTDKPFLARRSFRPPIVSSVTGDAAIRQLVLSTTDSPLKAPRGTRAGIASGEATETIPGRAAGYSAAMS